MDRQSFSVLLELKADETISKLASPKGLLRAGYCPHSEAQADVRFGELLSMRENIGRSTFNDGYVALADAQNSLVYVRFMISRRLTPNAYHQNSHDSFWHLAKEDALDNIPGSMAAQLTDKLSELRPY